MSVAFIAVGANIEPEKNIRAALTMLQQQTQVIGSSTFYRTKPIGRRDQPAYINGVWQIETELPPTEVKTRLLLPIEQQLGRVRTGDKFAPRTIDLDLILYDDLVLDDSDIARPFVYFPVVELLSGIACESAGGLPERMMRLLPQKIPTGEPGQPLAELTQELRDWIRG